MAQSFALSRAQRPLSGHAIRQTIAVLVALAIAVVAGRVLQAQVEGDRGIAPVTSSIDIDVGGIEVDVRGDSAEEAREAGWREAQRKGWAKLGGPSLPDSQLESLVSAVVIEQERIGPRRYIATLGVIFDRARAGRYLGGNAQRTQSAPMLLLPVTLSGGSAMVYQQRNPWQRVWAEYQAGSSRINYVRPSGAGGDSLMLTYGQTTRRSRLWWRNILDQFGAADVLVPIARLEYQYPGGPVKGYFTARYGPDSEFLDSFTLTAKNDQDLPQMLAQAVTRFDDIFEAALADGKLRPNPTLNVGGEGADPVLQRLIEIGRAAQAQERAQRAAAAAGETGEGTSPTPTPTPTAAVVSSYVVQFASPDAGTIDATLAAVRATAGVRGAATSSIAIGGTSVMSVSYGGSLSDLAGALRARGFTVTQGSNALAISR
ncbi:heavy-metal-associated domain-containing protein [Altererythrobacter luteolus]|uniref:Heavy-metal-associated domain-containing protein n=1 Tax=Pontixanthobacter luteolus TaxID=295089 RepID=A0A6I4UW84_9SPHN|nr:heavy-metal-associated domain-containing protein [Pontixanthobacter luteolus]MXP46127.1 heavy-metal-associated domain-containing protein [Pontixanthobacter luteolus]